MLCVSKTLPKIGLIGYWKFDEGTNTGAILDSSGYGNTGDATRRCGQDLVRLVTAVAAIRE